MGNVHSVINAFEYLGCSVEVINDPDRIAKRDFIVLPGVGSFRKAMESLKESHIDKALYYAVNNRGAKLLGICLGMQVLGSLGYEDGNTVGLGFINNEVEKFSPDNKGQLKIPHVGYNSVEPSICKGLFYGLPKEPHFYFNHSYRMLLERFKGQYALCNYGGEFLAAFVKDNIYGVQFHPEKSQSNGLLLLKNYIVS